MSFPRIYVRAVAWPSFCYVICNIALSSLYLMLWHWCMRLQLLAACVRAWGLSTGIFSSACVCVCLLIDVYLCGWAARRPPPSRRFYGAAFFFMNRWGKNPSFYFISFGFLVLHLFICVKYFVPRTHTHTPVKYI